MAKNQESRPRSKRTGKEKDVVADEVLQVGIDDDMVHGNATVTDPMAANLDESEVLELPVLPLRGTVVFPLTVVPLAAAQPRSLRLIDDVMSGNRTVALIMQKDAEQEGAGPDDEHRVGTIATIHQMMRVPD